MNPSQFDVCDSAQDAEVEAQLCAYNSAFDELGLRFRWDASTLALVARIDGEEAQIAAYIEAHHPHLLKAYSAGFLSRAILEKKNARYSARVSMHVESLDFDVVKIFVDTARGNLVDRIEPPDLVDEG